MSETIAAKNLVAWLLVNIPAIEESYRDEAEWQYGAGYSDDQASSYFILSFILKPYFLELLEGRGNDEEVQRIFNLLEYLANYGDAEVQTQLRVTMEEVDIWRVWQYMGKQMRQDFRDWLISLPAGNEHVPLDQYGERWWQEIEKLGGFENLTDVNLLLIRYKLVKEFGVVNLRAPKPGGAEWRAMKLPWPIH